ncbi:SusC/RagA family TonB-linked outer membrane protein [Robertkochia solimangrovi]|uniref:SusC/RagA family TonB-linked outer membrane protein n=1 Tax=Robertkochia solimangrovi TaxID=2213046 RepID=UPI00117D25FC|nr:SusC/RagA family TonB-linked outer membrane protein [Robertkochia solimangrovi]TRZ44238.1 SusC/RagA family TonB-linked outer membrane protein [Robertkochia solimangrovi]
MRTSFSGLLTLLLVLIVHTTYAQTKTITGIVTDDSNIPLPGANILIKGTSTGTQTDFDGNYSIDAAVGDVLVYSYVGQKTEERTVGAQDVINVQLFQDAQALEEVVVTGNILGTKATPRSQGYASVNLSSEDLTEVTNTNPFESLSGKVAGVDITAPAQPGASSKVIVRGFSSITGSNSPLYVIDGTPITNASNSSSGAAVDRTFDAGSGINDLDPNSIESMTVLKGASATALYGSRAANGVIIITTKKGKDAAKIRVDFTSSLDYLQVSRVPEQQTTFGEGWNGVGYSSLPTGGLGASNENGSWGPAFTGQVRPWGQIYNNSQQVKPYVALSDNVKDFYEIGNIYTNSFRISGGSENSDFSLTFTNTNSDGVIPTDADKYDRKAFNLNSGIHNEKFAVRVSANYITRDQNAVNTGQGDAAGEGNTFMQELLQVPVDVSIIDMEDYINNPFNNNSYFYTPYASNPYWVLNENGTKIRSNRVFGNLNFSYNFTDDISAVWQIGADIENLKRKSWGAIVEYLPGSPQDLLGTQEVFGGVTEYQIERRQYDTFLTINYDHDFTELFNLSAAVGMNYNQRSFDELSASVTDLDIPNYYELSNSATTPVVTQSNSLRRTLGLYATATLGFMDRYFLTLTARNDWTSTLPIGKNSYFYPSATGSAILLDSGATFLKLRGGISRVGNDTQPYRTESTLVQGVAGAYFGQINMPLGGVNSFELSSLLGNSELKPEITTEYEIGVEANLFNRRITLDASYYNRDTKDLLMDQLLPRSTGYLNITGNYADVNNKGIELVLGITPIRTDGFKWQFDYTFTKNENEITDLRGTDRFVINSAYNITFNAEEGQPLGVFRFRGPATNDEGQYIVDPNTGFYTQSDEEQYLGTSQRDFVMGFRNSFTFKNFNLSFSVDWKEGGKMYSYTKRLMEFVGNAPNTVYNDRNPFIIPNSVVDNGDGTYSENTTAVAYDQVTNFWGTGSHPAIEYTHMIDKTFVRLRDVSLSYNVPYEFVESLGLSSASISIYGKNLALWTPADNPYVDPEVTTFGSDLQSEFGEFAANPAQRTYGASLKLSF